MDNQVLAALHEKASTVVVPDLQHSDRLADRDTAASSAHFDRNASFVFDLPSLPNCSRRVYCCNRYFSAS